MCQRKKKFFNLHKPVRLSGGLLDEFTGIRIFSLLTVANQQITIKTRMSGRFDCSLFLFEDIFSLLAQSNSLIVNVYFLCY